MESKVFVDSWNRDANPRQDGRALFEAQGSALPGEGGAAPLGNAEWADLNPEGL